MEISDGVALIDGALTTDECEMFIDYFDERFHSQVSVKDGVIVSDFTRSGALQLRSEDSDLTGLSQIFNVSLDAYLTEYLGDLEFDRTQLYSPLTRFEFVKISRYGLAEDQFNILHQDQAGTLQSIYRYFAFRVFLNDVGIGGQMLFPLQSVRITPKTGTLVIWPAGFPYIYRDVAAETNDKYVLASWAEIALEERHSFYEAELTSENLEESRSRTSSGS